MVGTTPVTIHEEVVSSSKGIGDSWTLSTDEIHTSSVAINYDRWSNLTMLTIMVQPS